MYDAESLSIHSYFAGTLSLAPIETILDSLTGVVARPYILAFIRDLIQQGTPFTLGILDLDNFKSVNDNYGHKIGDRVLSRVSSDLCAFLGSDGVIGRFGGDEFLIVYLKSTAYDDVHAFFMSMYQDGGVLRKTLELDDLSLFVTGTLGSATFPDDAAEFDELFARIDKALYRGKSKGRNCFIMYVAAKHDQLRIPTLSKRSLYETLREMAEGFDSADEVRLKLFHAFRPLRDNLHLNRLLCLSRDGRLTDTENGMLIEMTGCVGESLPQGVCAVSDLNDMKRRCHALYGALTGLGLESVMFSQVAGADEDYACLLLCPEAHTKRIWQDDEYATAFILSRMLSQFLERRQSAGAGGDQP